MLRDLYASFVVEASMKSAAVQRKKLKQAKNEMHRIALQIRDQAQLDRMLMTYDEHRRHVIFNAMEPHLRFYAVFPTEENTAIVTPESFAKLREKYGEADNGEA